jgi:hypothetical protein
MCEVIRPRLSGSIEKVDNRQWVVGRVFVWMLESIMRAYFLLQIGKCKFKIAN